MGSGGVRDLKGDDSNDTNRHERSGVTNGSVMQEVEEQRPKLLSSLIQSVSVLTFSVPARHVPQI